jgi:hypothetical protein
MKTKPAFGAPKPRKDGTVPLIDHRMAVPVTEEEGALTNVPDPGKAFPHRGWEPI